MSVTVVEVRDGPRSTLAGPLTDQAALQAVLTTIYDRFPAGVVGHSGVGAGGVGATPVVGRRTAV